MSSINFSRVYTPHRKIGASRDAAKRHTAGRLYAAGASKIVLLGLSVPVPPERTRSPAGSRLGVHLSAFETSASPEPIPHSVSGPVLPSGNAVSPFAHRPPWGYRARRRPG